MKENDQGNINIPILKHSLFTIKKQSVNYQHIFKIMLIDDTLKYIPGISVNPYYFARHDMPFEISPRI